MKRSKAKLNEYLFVYGTLRSESIAARMMTEFGELVDAGTIPGTLYNVGCFPAATPPKKPNDRIVGEVYVLSDPEPALRRLDGYEGCPPDNRGMYRRERVTARLDSGMDLEVWVYIWNRSVDRLELIPSGDYMNPTKA